MKIFFDTEFIEDGRAINMLSIGLVREDGATYYAEVIDSISLWDTADPWVKENVIAHLKSNNTEEFVPELKLKKQIAKDIVEFVGEDPEFWAYYADYDWVVLCQLYGRMIDLPKGWPMFCRDLKQYAMDRGIEKIELLNEKEHDALSDALWVKKAYYLLNDN